MLFVCLFGGGGASTFAPAIPNPLCVLARLDVQPKDLCSLRRLLLHSQATVRRTAVASLLLPAVTW